MKIKIIVDSSSGLSQQEAQNLGWDLIPLNAEIDGKPYKIGINLDVDEFARMWRSNKKINTSTFATPPGVSQEVIDKYIENYDKIIIYSISKELSSQNSSLITLFKDNPKVHVVESKKISYLIVRDLLLFEQKINNGVSFDKAIEHFNQKNEKLLLVPQFNDALVKGGRLSKAAAMIAKLAKIVPIIRFENGILEKEGLGRVFTKTLDKLVKELFEKLPKENENYYLIIPHADNDEIEKIINSFKLVTNNYPRIASIKLPADISVHTGVGAVCVSFAEIKDEIKDKFLSIAKVW